MAIPEKIFTCIPRTEKIPNFSQYQPPTACTEASNCGKFGEDGGRGGEEREHSCLVGKCHSYIIGCCTLTQLCCTVAFAQSDLVAHWRVCCTQLNNEYCVVSLCFTAFLAQLLGSSVHVQRLNCPSQISPKCTLSHTFTFFAPL